MTVRAIRGATQLDVDEVSHLRERTTELLRAVFEANELDPADLVSILFTSTPDLVSGFPASAARELGLVDVPLMGAVEVAVPDAPSRVVRLMAHVNTEKPRAEIQHVYLHGAKALRRDLAK